MLEDKSIAEFFKLILSPKYLFPIWLAGFILLFLPEDTTNKLGLTEIIKSYRGVIGIVSLASFCIWLSVVSLSLWNYSKQRKINNNRRNLEEKHNQDREAQIIEQINHLSQGELFYLWMCLDKNQQTFVGCLVNPHISSLINKGLVQPPYGAIDLWNCPLTIRDFVWSYLRENKSSFLPENISEFRLSIETYEHLRDWQRKDFP